jgi:hypothetical protein
MNNAVNRITRLVAVVLTALCAQVLFAEAGPETVFHVAPTGRDSNAGDVAAPFASIERAQQAVREKIAPGLTGNVRVLIHGGTYELGKPLVFTPLDSGTAHYSITYAAVSNETVVVSGGRQITNWTKGDGNVWTAEVTDVKAGKWYFRNLYVNDRRATRARSPNADDPNPWYSIKGFDKDTWAMTLSTGQVAAWRNMSDVELVLLGPWTIIRKRIGFADPATSTIIPELPHLGSSGMEQPGGGTLCYLENAREFLDQPGEWYLDRTSGVLSYWPRQGEDLTTAKVIAPRLTRLLELRGTARQPVENLHFGGINFYFADATFPIHGYSGGSQGYYRPDDYPTTKAVARIDVAAQFEFAQSCSLENGELAHVGGNALHLFKGCSQIVIQGNRIFDVGDGGVEIGDRPYPPINPLPSLAVQNHSNAIINNDISDCGATYHDADAVLIRPAAQTLVAHNSIHDCLHHGIVIGTTIDVLPPGIADGYWIKNNEIHNVCQMMSDSGPIYVWGRQTGNKTISGNLIHDTKAYAAIYFDDQSSGYRVEQNVVYNINNLPISYGNPGAGAFLVRDNYWQGTNDFVPGKTGYALKFDSGRFLDIPHQVALEPLRLTVAAWVNLTAIPTGNNPCAWIVCKNTNELRNTNYSLLISNNNVGAYLNIGGGRTNCFAAWSSTGPLKPSTWHLLAMSYDGTNLNVLCDGQQVGSTAIGRARTTGKSALRLGKRGDGYSPSFPGLINEVRWYKRALSDVELQAQYTSPSTPDSRTAPDLVFQWNANDMYSKLQPIMANAGPEEPYRSRFAASREPSSQTGLGSSTLSPPLADRPPTADR